MLSETAAAGPSAVRVLAIADTDSYLKWSAATLDALPTSWGSAQLLIENPVMPSAAQMQAACACRVVGECVGRGLQLANGWWALPDFTPGPILSDKDALSRRQFAYKSSVAKVSNRQTEDLRTHYTERTQGESIVHQLFTFASPSRHVTRVRSPHREARARAFRAKPGVHRACRVHPGETTPRL